MDNPKKIPDIRTAIFLLFCCSKFFEIIAKNTEDRKNGSKMESSSTRLINHVIGITAKRIAANACNSTIIASLTYFINQERVEYR